MKANREDRTHRQNTHGSHSKDRHLLVIPALLAASLGLYLLHDSLGTGPREVNAGRDASEAPTPVIVKPDPADSVSDPPRQTAEMAFWEQVERDRERPGTTSPSQPEPAAAGRQTRFNDQNYTPAGHVNIIQSVPVRPQNRSAGGSRQALTGSQSATVRWEDARGNRSSWKTRFEYRDGRIDNSTFCLNIGKGSIPYRECRKGAGQWLRDQCRSSRNIDDQWRQMYCRAHGSYRT